MSASSKKHSNRSKHLKNGKFSRYSFVVFVLVFASIGGYLLLKSNAAAPPAAPSLYLSPDTATVTAGSTFNVAVYENSGTDTVNVVQANLSYSNSQLSYIGYTDSTAFSLAAENPTGDTGSLRFARGTCGGCAPVTGTQLVVTIKFKALTAGSAAVNFDTGSILVKSTTNTAEPGLNKAGGVYTVTAPTSPPPPSPSPVTPPPASPPAGSPPPASGGTTKSPSSGGSSTSTKSTTPSPSPVSPATPSPLATAPSPTSSSKEPINPSVSTAAASGPANSANIAAVGAAAAALALVVTGIFWSLQHIRSNPRLGSAPTASYSWSGALKSTPSAPPGTVISTKPESPNTKLPSIPVATPPTPAAQAPTAPAAPVVKVISPNKTPTGSTTEPKIPKSA